MGLSSDALNDTFPGFECVSHPQGESDLRDCSLLSCLLFPQNSFEALKFQGMI